MKKILFAVMLISNCLFGQQIEIKTGEQAQIFTDAAKGGTQPLDYKNLELVNERFNPIKATYGGKHYAFEATQRNSRGTNGFIATKSHLYMPFVELKEDKQKVYLQEIDAQGKLKGECKLVVDDDFSLKFFFPKVPNDAEGLAVSDNGEKIVHITTAGFGIYPVPQKLIITVLDENRNVLWAKVQEFPNYLDPDFSLLDFTVTNEGTVALSASITSHPKSKKDDEIATLKVFVISKNDMKEGELPLPAGEKPAFSKLLADPEGMLIVAGIYESVNISHDFNNGYYIAKFGMAKANLINKAVFPFDERFSNVPHSSAKTTHAVAWHCQLVNVLKSTSGTYFLVTCFGVHGRIPTERFNNLENGDHLNEGVYNGWYNSNVYNYEHTFISAYDSTLKKTSEAITRVETNTKDISADLKAFAMGENILLVNNRYLSNEKNFHQQIVTVLMDGSCKVIDSKSVKGEFNYRFVRRFGEKGVVVASPDPDNIAPVYFSKKYNEALITVNPTPRIH